MHRRERRCRTLYPGKFARNDLDLAAARQLHAAHLGVGDRLGLKEQSMDKIGILKNNKLEAVVISTDEYERLKSLEELFSTLEHKEIYDVIQSRQNTPLSSYVSFEDMARKFNIDTKKL